MQGVWELQGLFEFVEYEHAADTHFFYFVRILAGVCGCQKKWKEVTPLKDSTLNSIISSLNSYQFNINISFSSLKALASEDHVPFRRSVSCSLSLFCSTCGAVQSIQCLKRDVSKTCIRVCFPRKMNNEKARTTLASAHQNL